MAGSVNKVILVGNLGQDPDIRTFQNGGKIEFSRSMLSSESLASSPPSSISASVAMTPGPPAAVTMASLGPLGSFRESRISAQSKRSAISFTRNTPALLKAAS